MTRGEAIEILEQFKRCLSDVVFDEKGSEAWQMAIQTLSQEPCEDVISREDAIKTVHNMRVVCDTEDIDDYYELLVESFKQLLSVTQKSGKWERHYIRPNVYKDLLWYCSACGNGCGYNNAFMFDYCPNCGAKMSESEE